MQREFPLTDFEKIGVAMDEITFDGARRDSIPPIYDPVYVPISDATDVGPLEPVIGVIINGDARAYPLRIMLWHEIVNEVIGGVPVLISYCPLCNSGVVYDRRVGGETLVFGNTGRIRKYDMVMFDHSTESWWQQLTGTAIIGDRLGSEMTLLPSRLESVAAFAARAPQGQILVPGDPRARPYGNTPYRKMDAPAAQPRFSAQFPVPRGVDPMEYFVVVNGKAWPLKRLMREHRITESGVTLLWSAGRNSLHDTQKISDGRDLGNVVVTKQSDPGDDVPYDLVFAFSFSALRRLRIACQRAVFTRCPVD